MTTYEQLTIDGDAVQVCVESTIDVDAHVQAIVAAFGFDPVEAALGRIKIAMSGPVPQIGERTDDRRTSKGHRSDDVRRFSRSSQVGRMLVAFTFAKDGLTDAEVTDRVANDGASRSQWEGCRRRASDLRAAGYVTDSGQERDGRIVWVVTPQGRAAAQRIVDTGWSR